MLNEKHLQDLYFLFILSDFCLSCISRQIKNNLKNDSKPINFGFGDKGLTRSLWAPRKEPSRCLGLNWAKQFCLLAVWRSFFLVGLQDLSTLVSPRMSVWSWSISSTAPRRLFYSHSAKGCYEDAVSSALMGENTVMHRVNSMSPRSPRKDGKIGMLGVLPGI